MARVESGALRGFYRPDYGGRSLVDLMASLIRARGGASAHTGLGSEWEAKLERPRHLVLLVIDGLGLAQRRSYLDSVPASRFLGEVEPLTLSSVFPATTAAAVTTLMTGASPAEHGILGWFLNLHDLGVVSAILPTTSRTDMAIFGGDFPLNDYLAIPRPIESMRGRRVALTHRFILESRFSRAASQWSETRAVESLAVMESTLKKLVRSQEPAYLYAYWPGYDGLSHHYGPESTEALQHLAMIDAMLARLRATFARHETALLVTADHGFVATPPEHHVDLSRVETLYDSLATLPSGDARAVSLFVRPARLQAVRERLDSYRECFNVVDGEALFEAEAFGPGAHHPALYGRVGDLVLLAKDTYALSAPLRGAPPHCMPGNHGGMTEPEMRIPLFFCTP